MPFINGFATEDDIKIELFLFEPEQISDLLIVPLSNDVARFLASLFFNEINQTISNGWINLPFSTNLTNTKLIQPNTSIPTLLQRFNPFNKPYADEYSKKLFDFLYQFKNHYIFERSRGYSRKVISKNNNYNFNLPIYKGLNNYLFNELNLLTENIGLTFDYSYYYAERIDEPYNIFFFARFYEYSNIRNECIETPSSRRWLLNFDNKFCNGTTFNIRDDILINSLVLTFNDKPELNLYWTDEQKEFIISQIPDYYLYDNLDELFNELTNELINRVPDILEELEFVKSIDYSVVWGYDNGLTVNEQNKIYNQSTLNIFPGLLLYANNNNWNNTYNWINYNNDIKDTIYNDIKNRIYIKYGLFSFFTVIDGQLVRVARLRPFIRNLTDLQFDDLPFFNPRFNTDDDRYMNDSEGNRVFSNLERNYIYKSYQYTSKVAGLIYDSVPDLFFIIVEKGKYNTSGNNAFPDFNSPFIKFDFAKGSYDYTINRISDSFVNNYNKHIDYLNVNENDINNNSYFFNANNYIFSNELKITDKQSDLDSIHNQIILSHQTCYMANCDLEDIKKDIKEIHRSLDAGLYGNLSDGSEGKRLNNLGTKIDLIAKVLGLHFDSDLNEQIKPKIEIEVNDGIDTELLPGYLYEKFGLIQDFITGELTPGIVYKNISNKLVPNGFDEDNYNIKPGIINLCHSIPEYIERFRDDLDKALNLQEMGAAYIPNADASGKICYFEGLGTLLVEVAWMLSSFSENINTIEISSLVSQAMLYEVLKAFGQPITIKNFDIKNSNPNNNSGVSTIHFPGLSVDAPSSLTQTLWILQNLQPLIGAVTSFINDEELNK